MTEQATASRSATPFVPATSTMSLVDQAELQVRWLSDWTGLPWFAACAESGRWLAASNAELPPLAHTLSSDAQHWMESLGSALITYGFVPAATSTPQLRMCGYVRSGDPLTCESWICAARGSGWDEDRLALALAKLPICSADVLDRVLRSALAQWQSRELAASGEKRLQRLASTKEFLERELGLLRELTAQLGPSSTVADVAATCLRRLHELVPADAHFLWVRGVRGTGTVHRHGEIRFAESRLVAFLEQKSPTQPLFSRTPPAAWGIDARQLKHFAGVPIGNRLGWLISCNFHASALLPAHAELLKSLAAVLAVPLQRGQLQHENEELALSIVQSLVNTLDAKDRCTAGHSERVARIARRLGKQLKLTPAELDDLFLSGMLHDIGKIGINDKILQKTEPLTPEEFREVQRHPVIGYQLLAPIRRLKPILPGVRHHHEAYNGRGYPDRLCGESIPLMARIIAVADAFDAMISDRPYRPGMPRDRVDDIFRRGAGEQWDAKVVHAYFQARNDIFSVVGSNPLSGEIRVPEWVLEADPMEDTMLLAGLRS